MRKTIQQIGVTKNGIDRDRKLVGRRVTRRRVLSAQAREEGVHGSTRQSQMGLAVRQWSRGDQLPIPQKRHNITEHTADGGVLLYDASTGKTFHLNETALTIWNACNGRTTVRSIALEVASRFDGEMDVIRDDVDQVLAMLADSELLDHGAVQ